MSAYTDKLVNALNPEEQISSLLTYDDQISEAAKALIAEKVGRPLSGKSGTAGTDGTALTDFQDTTYNAFSLGDAQRWIYISGSSNGNDGWYHIETYVNSGEVTISPALAAAETGLSWQMYAEPNLQDDINLAITQLRDIIDPSSDWFQNMPRGFNPCNTDASNTKNEKMSLKTIADNWWGAQARILDVVTSAITGVTTSDTGKLFLTALGYADPANRQGLVIQKSVANAGDYYDEVALASITVGKHKVILIDSETGAEFKTAAGNLIYGVLEDGADHSGSGEGTDVFIKFVYDNAGTPTAYTWTADDPSSIIAYMPYRKCGRNILEHDGRIFRSAGIVGDAELAEDVSEIRDGLGLGDGEGAGDWDLTNTGNYFPFSELSGDYTMEDIVNKLNEEIGDRDYLEENYVTDGESISDSIDKLDQALADVTSIKTKIIERVTSTITRGTAHTIPFASGSSPSITTYKLDTSYNGLHMDVYVGGKKLIPHSGAATQDGEYGETSTTSITPQFTIPKGQIIEYIIRDDA